MAAFEYRQAQEVRDAFNRHNCRYLFIGKSGAILLGFPDTTQDADLFVERSPENGAALVSAIKDLGFTLSEDQAAEIHRDKDFIQLDDIIASKLASNRAKDRESLPRLESFRDYWQSHRKT